MPKWYVEIYVGREILHIGEPFVRKDDQTVLSFLSTCLQDPSFMILAVGNYHFLVSTDFDTLDNEDDVYQYAQSQLPILNGMMRLKFNRDICSIKIGDVYHLNNDDKLDRTVMRTTVTGEMYPPESFLQAANAQDPSSMNILLMTRHNPLVEEALQYYSLPHSWFNLRKMFEIIKNSVRAAERQNKLPKNTWNTWVRGWANNFWETAHSYYWSGPSALHSSVGSKKRAGVTPMPLETAKKHITDLFIKWLQTNP